MYLLKKCQDKTHNILNVMKISFLLKLSTLQLSNNKKCEKKKYVLFIRLPNTLYISSDNHLKPSYKYVLKDIKRMQTLDTIAKN